MVLTESSHICRISLAMLEAILGAILGTKDLNMSGPQQSRPQGARDRALNASGAVSESATGLMRVTTHPSNSGVRTLRLGTC